MLSPWRTSPSSSGAALLALDSVSPFQSCAMVLTWSLSLINAFLDVIQLAKMSGYSVVTTCSPRSFDLVKSFGAEASYSCKLPAWTAVSSPRRQAPILYPFPDADPETPSRIPAAYPALRLALDCISSGGTTPLTSCSLGASSKYQKWVATLLSPQAGDTTGVDVHISRILSCKAAATLQLLPES